MTPSNARVPGPDHPITIAPTVGRVTVTVAGQVIADTTRALTLKEAAYPSVQYIPRADVDMASLSRTDHATTCPYKGRATYFSIPAAGAKGVNVIWSYEVPYDAVGAIREHLAFYPERAEIAVQPGG